MQIKIKKLHPDAVIPKYSNEGDACVDLVDTGWTQNGDYIEYKTDLAIEIPEGYFGLVRPRSSVSKMGLIFKTSGIIDSGYRGEITVRFQYNPVSGKIYATGERVAQMMILPYPKIEFVEVDELS